MSVDIKKLRSKLPYPSGKDFYQLFKRILGSKIKYQPMLTAKGLEYDPSLYIGMVAFISRIIGHLECQQGKAKDIQVCTKVLNSDAMQSLREDTYGTYSENDSRLKCYKWIQKNAPKVF